MKATNCPYCDHQIRDQAVKAHTGLRRCGACDLIFRGENNTAEKLLNSYRHHYFAKHASDQLDGSRENIHKHALAKLSSGQIGQLLDVGTGCGFFLVAARRRGWKVSGIDPSKDSIKLGQSLNGLDIFEGTLADYDGASDFDAVTFINVLGHIKEPWKAVEKAALLLKKGGRIYIRFPNARFHVFLHAVFTKLHLFEWIPRYLVFHDFSFSHRYMERLLADNGFHDIHISNSPISNTFRRSNGKNLTCSRLGAASLYSLAVILQRISLHRIYIGSSLEAIAVK